MFFIRLPNKTGITLYGSFGAYSGKYSRQNQEALAPILTQQHRAPARVCGPTPSAAGRHSVLNSLGRVNPYVTPPDQCATHDSSSSHAVRDGPAKSHMARGDGSSTETFAALNGINQRLQFGVPRNATPP